MAISLQEGDARDAGLSIWTLLLRMIRMCGDGNVAAMLLVGAFARVTAPFAELVLLVAGTLLLDVTVALRRRRAVIR